MCMYMCVWERERARERDLSYRAYVALPVLVVESEKEKERQKERQKERKLVWV